MKDLGYVLSDLTAIVDRGVDELEAHYTDGTGTVRAWTIQRLEVLSGLETTGRHVPSWSTVRADRRSQYAFATVALEAAGCRRPAHQPPVGLGHITIEPEFTALGAPPVWLFTSQVADGHYWPLDEWLCDASCGDGTYPGDGCQRTHLSPLDVAIEVELSLDQVAALSWRRWDFALTGGYLPADTLDFGRFIRTLDATDPGHDTKRADQWSWPMRVLARASISRAFTTSPTIPGTVNDPARDGGWLRCQVVTPTLENDDVLDVREGPDVDVESWWDAAVAANPDMSVWRRFGTAELEALHEAGRAGDSA